MVPPSSFENLFGAQCVPVPKMLNYTDTSFRYDIFSIPIPVLFSVPNFSETGSETFFDTKFYRYQFRDFFPVPIFSDTGSDTTSTGTCTHYKCSKFQNFGKKKSAPVLNFPRLFSGTNFFQYHHKNEKFLVPVRHTLLLLK